MLPELKLGKSIIGESYPPYIIAELSANHNQSLDMALNIVEEASVCGANAIKLQTFRPDTLTLNSFKGEFYIPSKGSLWAGERLWDLYRSASMPWEWHKPIFSRARELGLDCISTAFDEESVNFLVDVGVDAIKIASFELINIPLIKKAAATNIPLILSTGMGSLEEISEAVNAVFEISPISPVLLKCTSAYPALPSDANLKVINDLQERFNVLVGVSDHSMSISVVASSIALGACVVEKHFTLSRSFSGPDSSFSLEPSEFKSMVSVAHECFLAKGVVRYGVQESELISAWERPSIWVTSSIKEGDKFTADNLKVLRPSGGMHPRNLSQVIGLTSALNIDACTPLIAEYIKYRT